VSADDLLAGFTSLGECGVELFFVISTHNDKVVRYHGCVG
jgi:hypothetical protein